MFSFRASSMPRAMACRNSSFVSGGAGRRSRGVRYSKARCSKPARFPSDMACCCPSRITIY